MTPAQRQRVNKILAAIGDLAADERLVRARVLSGDDDDVFAAVAAALGDAVPDAPSAGAREPDAATHSHAREAGAAHDANAALDADFTIPSAPKNDDGLDITVTASAESLQRHPSIAGYRFVRELGRGGQGVVYLAIQETTGQKVALKSISPQAFGNRSVYRRFLREIRLIAQLRHPNIISVYDSGETPDGNPYYVMEYISGLTLHRYVRREGLSLRGIVELVLPIVDAIRFAHERGVIHRDLKPSNILVDNNGVPKVLDFGLAKQLATTDTVITEEGGGLCGTLSYMAPEQVRGETDEIDARVDVYAMGIILYELLTGQYPYLVDGTLQEVLHNISAIPPIPLSRRWRPDSGVHAPDSGSRSFSRCPIDADIEGIVLKTLEKDRRHRYASMRDLAADLNSYRDGGRISVNPRNVWQRARRVWRYRRLRIVLSGALVLAASLIAIGVVAWGEHRARAERQRADQVRVEQLLREARGLMTQHDNLREADQQITDALNLMPDSQDGLLLQGRLRVLQALEAPLAKKNALADEALSRFEAAHIVSGGSPFLGREDLSDLANLREGVGSCTALWAAIDTLLLSGRIEEYRALLDHLPADCRGRSSWKPVYDPRLDALIDNESTALTPEQAGVTPDREAAVVWAFPTGVGSLDPSRGQSYAAFVKPLLYDRLFVINQKMQVIPNPNLVKSGSYTSSADGLVQRLALLPESRWQDGKRLTARDIEFSWETFGRGQTDDPYSSVRALDDVQLEFTRKEPAATSKTRWDLAFGIFPLHVYQTISSGTAAVDSDRAKQFVALLDDHPIGNGPYRLVERRDDRIVLDRWEAYPGRHPAIRRFVIQLNLKGRLLAERLADGRIDASDMTSTQYRWDINGASFTGQVYKRSNRSLKYSYIGWNLGHPVLGDLAVRQAIAQAIPLDDLRQEIGAGLYETCPGIFGGWPWGQADGFGQQLLAFNPDAARRRLDEAGWRVSESASLRQRRGVPARFNLLVPEEVAPGVRRSFARIQQQLRNVGLAVEIEWLPFRQWKQHLGDNRFDAVLSAVIPNAVPDIDRARWASDGTRNRLHYSNPDVDDRFELAARSDDPETRTLRFQEIQKLIYSDQPALFLWQQPALWTFNLRLRGVRFNLRGPILFYPGPRDWWVAPERP